MTDSERDSQIDVQTIIVSLLCLAGAGAGGAFLYSDINSAGRAGVGKPVGQVSSREAQVRRKQSSSFVWNNVQMNEDLYKKDSIQTGKGSAVSIKLPDGSVLDMGENSLIVMDEGAKLSLGFLRGSVVIHKADGDSKISVGKDGKQKVEVLDARLVKPEALARFFVSAQEPKVIDFLWQVRSKTTSASDSYIVQISKDQRFHSTQTKNSVARDSKVTTLRESLLPGRYYWRVLARGNPVTETREFRVLSALPLLPVWPNDHQVVNLDVSSPAAAQSTVQFRWLVSKGNNSENNSEEVDVTQGEHRIEIARDPEFSNGLLNESINPVTGRAQISKVHQGKVFWRIRSQYGNFTVLSGVKSFELGAPIIVQPKPSPTPSVPPVPIEVMLPVPTDVQPPSGTEFNLLDKKVRREASWSPVPGAELYEVSLTSEKGSTKKVIFQAKTNKTKVDFSKLSAGDYSWTVRAFDAAKKPGTPLSQHTFKVGYGQLLAPPKVISEEVQ